MRRPGPGLDAIQPRTGPLRVGNGVLLLCSAFTLFRVGSVALLLRSAFAQFRVSTGVMLHGSAIVRFRVVPVHCCPFPRLLRCTVVPFCVPPSPGCAVRHCCRVCRLTCSACCRFLFSQGGENGWLSTSSAVIQQTDATSSRLAMRGSPLSHSHRKTMSTTASP